MRALRLFSLALLVSCASSPAPAQKPPPPTGVITKRLPPVPPAPVVAGPSAPVAKKIPHPQTLFGRELPDDYFWLRQKDSPDVVAYLNAEAAYADALMKPTVPLQETLYKEMVGRIVETDASVPVRDGGYFYYTRTVEGQQYPIHCRKSAKGVAKDDLVGATATAPEEVLLDLNELGKGQKFIGLGEFEVSDDARTLAYSLDLTGFRQFTLHFKDLRTGAVSAEEIPRVDSVAWARDGKTVFYVVEDAVSKRPNQLFRHVVGDDPAKDVLIYDEKDELFDLGVGTSRSKDTIVLEAGSKTTSEARILSAATPRGTFQVVEPRQHDHQYYVEQRGRELIIRTNSPSVAGGPKARNFRLVTAPLATPGRAHWKEILPHRDDVMLEGVDVFTHALVLHERADAVPRLVVMPARGKPATIPMPEAIYALFGDDNPEADPPAYRFHFQSPVTPDSTFDYDFKTAALTLRKRLEIRGYDPSRYQTERIHAVAADGTRVPISLVYRKDQKADVAHPNPMLLYGYGSYGATIPLLFRGPTVSLLDRGVVFAMAHIRGGGDLGKAWHEQGRMATKMNTFTDFIACGEELVKDGWTSKDKLVIQGGSAGGLLMGAVTNLRPDLWHAVVAQVPFVDVVNTMLDESLPLTVGEFEEWGNPKKPDEFAAIVKYSPYDNIERKAYPTMLVETSYNDSQVMYWEPAKYVARLRAMKTDQNPLLFKVRMDPAGHGGPSGRYSQLHEVAYTYAFVLHALGIHD